MKLNDIPDHGDTAERAHLVNGGIPARLASLIDHSALRPEVTRCDIELLCREAAEFRFATVCVNPTWVSLALARLKGTGVGVCSVVGFPLGATTTETKVCEARRAISDGATELDMVMNLGALKSGDPKLVTDDIAAVVEVSRATGSVSKVIIEAALLTDDEKAIACRLVEAAGADFVKTSTGFGPGGATVADVKLMRHVVGARLGVKAAGGIRDLDTVQALVAAGATRIGTSAGVGILTEALRRRPSARPGQR